MGTVPGTGKAQRYFWAHVMEPSDGCRDWPYATLHGYGCIRRDSRTVTVTVLTCEAWHGPRPKGMEVAHSCGRPICWAGEHLRWATRADNHADKVGHGTAQRGARAPRTKLTEGQVLEIRKRYAAGGISYQQLGEDYGMTRTGIMFVVRRKTWAWLD